MSSKNEQGKEHAHLRDSWDPLRTRELYSLKPHPQTGRLIDAHPGTRTRPMRVLCFGMSRTGTMSMLLALQKLKYKPYHMAVAAGSPRSNLGVWREALDAKFNGKGKKFGRAEFDKVLGQYDAVLDVPTNCFVEELVEAYPDAKVILTKRDMEAWLKSIASTAGVVLGWDWSVVAPWDPAMALPWYEHAKVVVPPAFGTFTDFSSPQSPARQHFREHYELVRTNVPKDKVLEFQVQEGWKPLCDFLGFEPPNEDFPRVNDAVQFIMMHRLMWWMAFAKMVGKIGLMAAVPVAGVAGAMWWRRRV